MTCVLQEDEGPKDEDPETNEKNGRLYDKAGKIRKMKHEQASPFLLDTLTNVFFYTTEYLMNDSAQQRVNNISVTQGT
jgi:hypothetical protein